MQKNSSTKKGSTFIYLVGATGKMGKAITHLAASQKGYQITPSLQEADTIIDFSSPEGTRSALKLALTHNIPLVTGTTALPKELEEALKEGATHIPILSSPNFSFGIALILKILPTMTTAMQHDYTCKIVETHHVHKKDAPSGTAKRLAHALKGNVPIESIREGEVTGEHRIFFNLDGEIIELRHEALSREVFAKGALMAAKFLVNKPAGLYTLMDLVN